MEDWKKELHNIEVADNGQDDGYYKDFTLDEVLGEVVVDEFIVPIVEMAIESEKQKAYEQGREESVAITEEDVKMIEQKAVEEYKKYKQESPYCEVCDSCSLIECCGIRNFLDKHVKGKTGCKNEQGVILDIISCVGETEQAVELARPEIEREAYDKLNKKLDWYVDDSLNRNVDNWEYIHISHLRRFMEGLISELEDKK